MGERAHRGARDMTRSGSQLEFRFKALADSDRHTTYFLSIAIGGGPVWPTFSEEDEFDIQIDDLLAYLTEFWKPLMLRQVYPIDVSSLRPSGLRRKAEERWAALQPELAQREDEIVSAFEEAHDLSRAFAGVFGLPSFWIMRSGDCVIVETAGELFRVPFEEVRAELSAAGDFICDRLLAVDDERWKMAVYAWNNRNQEDEVSLLAWSASIAPSIARELIDGGFLDPPASFDDAANDEDELRIAARMAGALPTEQIREVIKLAREFDGTESHNLHLLAAKCSDFLEKTFAHERPFIQGEALAWFVREQLEIAEEYVEVFNILSKLDVAVRISAVEPPTLDGLTIWGRRFGPGVFLNSLSTRIVPGQHVGRSEVSAGARVTAAHELCHLLVDGRHALSAVEVLKARMPVGVEQRAKSFAGEFLMPTRVAARHWNDAGRPRNRTAIEEVVVGLVREFGVTRSVAAWKLEHGAGLYNIDIGAILDAVAPRR